ncbi:MAG: hypothetical protein BWZ10_02683 [candidate division BRC1 bacterium ADurb.BinA364]|nr:MAG: hypothetical protein BWZ10_02683 [candidate division BRC1 bacterium ADurb.BinA364]
MGRADEALSHLELVRKRLTAWEIELRRARALWLLGRDGEALEAAGRAFAIQPARIMAYPAIGAWIQGMPVSREALSAEMEAGVLAPGGD